MCYPKDKRKILFFAISPMNYEIFRPIQERLKPDPRLEIWFTSKYEGSRNPKKLYNMIGLGDERLIRYRLSGLKKFDMYLSPDIMCVSKRAKVKVQLFHGASFKGKAYSRKVLQYDKLFIAGEYMRRRFISKGILEDGDEKIEKVGMPKLDMLLNGRLNREEIVNRLNLNKDLPTIIYAPTWSQRSSLYFMGEPIIEEISDMDVNFLIKLHDHSYDLRKNSIDWRKKLDGIRRSNVRVIRDYNIVPYLFISDILITDLSSVANEYTLLDRPIVFVDSPELIRRYEDTVDLDTWGRKTGYVVKEIKELKEAIEKSISNPGEFSQIRRKVAQDLFYNHGNATDKAVEVIYHVLGLEH